MALCTPCVKTQSDTFNSLTVKELNVGSPA
jgi:hypothetical protein